MFAIENFISGYYHKLLKLSESVCSIFGSNGDSLNSKNDKEKLLTDVERKWYEQYAKDILGGRFVCEQFCNSLQPIVFGLCGVIGVLKYGWSAEQQIVFMIVGIWVTFACNLTKISCMYQGMQNSVKTFEETGGVNNIWYTVARLRNPDAKNYPDARQNAVGIQVAGGNLKQRVTRGTKIDLLMGGLATILFFILAYSGEVGFNPSALAGTGFLFSLLGFLAFDFLLTVFQVIDYRRNADDRQVMMYPGFVGVSLFMLFFIFVMANDFSSNAAKATILVINALTVCWGIGKITWSICIWRQTVWLSRQPSVVHSDLQSDFNKSTKL